MIDLRKERNMQRFSVSLLLCLMCLNATAGAYLPVVDVSSGTVSARAAFGEEITVENRVAVAPVAKKVVARTARKSVANTNSVVAANTNDVLKPMRPSSDLWARNESPLRMPRMDEIAVVRSDDMLPEESLDAKPVRVAARSVKKTQSDTKVSNHEMMAEINSLRSEIARLNELQKQTDARIADSREVIARPEILDKFESKPETKLSQNTNGVNIRREVVPMESNQNSVARAIDEKPAEPIIARVSDMSKMSPNELKKAFKKTYLSENKHLSTYQVDNRYDVVSDMTTSIEGFNAQRDLSEAEDDEPRTLEIKISFMNGDAGLSRENYNLLSKYATIVVNNPKRAIQVAIPESVTHNKDGRKLAARRLAIVEQVLRDTGVAEQRIVPVLSQRSDDSFVLRIISGDMYESLTEQKRNMFGDNVSKKTYKSMSW